jgi:hypothetical protein
MTQINNCPLCEEPSTQVVPIELDKQYTCNRCGDFTLFFSLARIESEQFRRQYGLSDKRTVANISGWVQEHPGCGLDDIQLLRLSNSPTPSVAERGIKILNFL